MKKKMIAIAASSLGSILIVPALAFGLTGMSSGDVGPRLDGGNVAVTVESTGALADAGTPAAVAGCVTTGCGIVRDAAVAPGFVDADGDGVCDNIGTGAGAGAGRGAGAGYVDADGDGVCDNIGTGAGNGNGAGNGRGGYGGGHGGGHHRR